MDALHDEEKGNMAITVESIGEDRVRIGGAETIEVTIAELACVEPEFRGRCPVKLDPDEDCDSELEFVPERCVYVCLTRRHESAIWTKNVAVNRVKDAGGKQVIQPAWDETWWCGLRARIEQLRDLLEEKGIEPPSGEGPQ